MKKITLLLIFFSFAIISFAAKTYTLTLTVKDHVTLKPLPLAKVSIFTSIGKMDLGKTDVNGKIVIPELSDKKIEVLVEAEDSRYQTTRMTILNSKKANLTREITMKFTFEEQMKIYDALDEKYNDTQEPFVDQRKDVDTSEFISAEFIGGRAAMMKFLANNIQYPDDCINEGIEGKVYLEFFIQKDGRITHVKATKQVHTSMDLEAIRVMRDSPKWKPATLKGKPIKSVFYLPINFRLN